MWKEAAPTLLRGGDRKRRVTAGAEPGEREEGTVFLKHKKTENLPFQNYVVKRQMGGYV